jgi:hypothetical protein
MSTIQANIGLGLQVAETIPIGDAEVASPPTVTHQITDAVTLLNASSTPPGALVASGSVTLSGGTTTLDLTECLGPTVNSVPCPVNFTGKKINAYKIRANPNNTQPITVQAAGSNGYLLLGTSGLMELWPGDSCEHVHNASLPTVSSTTKAITVTSSMTAAQFDIILVGG